jgi:hypothetical protein
MPSCALWAPSTDVRESRIRPWRSEKVATECLKATQWAMEPAIDHYYSSGLAAMPGGTNMGQIETLFAGYKGEHACAHLGKLLGTPGAPQSSSRQDS